MQITKTDLINITKNNSMTNEILACLEEKGFPVDYEEGIYNYLADAVSLEREVNNAIYQNGKVVRITPERTYFTGYDRDKGFAFKPEKSYRNGDEIYIPLEYAKFRSECRDENERVHLVDDIRNHFGGKIKGDDLVGEHDILSRHAELNQMTPQERDMLTDPNIFESLGRNLKEVDDIKADKYGNPVNCGKAKVYNENGIYIKFDKDGCVENMAVDGESIWPMRRLTGEFKGEKYDAPVYDPDDVRKVIMEVKQRDPVDDNLREFLNKHKDGFYVKIDEKKGIGAGIKGNELKEYIKQKGIKANSAAEYSDKVAHAIKENATEKQMTKQEAKNAFGTGEQGQKSHRQKLV